MILVTLELLLIVVITQKEDINTDKCSQDNSNENYRINIGPDIEHFIRP